MAGGVGGMRDEGTQRGGRRLLFQDRDVYKRQIDTVTGCKLDSPAVIYDMQADRNILDGGY